MVIPVVMVILGVFVMTDLRSSWRALRLSKACRHTEGVIKGARTYDTRNDMENTKSRLHNQLRFDEKRRRGCVRPCRTEYTPIVNFSV